MSINLEELEEAGRKLVRQEEEEIAEAIEQAKAEMFSDDVDMSAIMEDAQAEHDLHVAAMQEAQAEAEAAAQAQAEAEAEAEAAAAAMGEEPLDED